NIVQDSFERFAAHRRLRRQRSANLARLCSGKHRKRLNASIVIRNPVHHRMPVTTKLLGSHVQAFFVWQSCSSVLRLFLGDTSCPLWLSPCGVEVSTARAKPRRHEGTRRRLPTPTARSTPAWCTQTKPAHRVDARRRCCAIREAWIRSSHLPVAACRKTIAIVLRDPRHQVP